MQNFRAKPGTVMRDAPEPQEQEYLAAVATARVVFGPHLSVQVPPNLSDAPARQRLIDAGIDDWGGVSPLTPDHVNPERPWPAIEALAATTREAGKVLRERLALHPRYALRPDPWLAGKMRAPVEALAAADGLATEGQIPEPIPWQDPEVGWKPRTISLEFAKTTTELRPDAAEVYGRIDGDATERRRTSLAPEPRFPGAPHCRERRVLRARRLVASAPFLSESGRPRRHPHLPLRRRSPRKEILRDRARRRSLFANLRRSHPPQRRGAKRQSSFLFRQAKMGPPLRPKPLTDLPRRSLGEGGFPLPTFT